MQKQIPKDRNSKMVGIRSWILAVIVVLAAGCVLQQDGGTTSLSTVPTTTTLSYPQIAEVGKVPSERALAEWEKAVEEARRAIQVGPVDVAVLRPEIVHGGIGQPVAVQVRGVAEHRAVGFNQQLRKRNFFDKFLLLTGAYHRGRNGEKIAGFKGR